MKYLFFFLLLALSLSGQGAYYVSPTGIGNGSFSAPWGFQMGMNNTVIQPGDTLFMRGGVYKGIYTHSLNGTAAKPIIIMPYNNERVVIDGSLVGQSFKNKACLTLNGSYTWVVGLEVTNSDPERTISVSGSNPIERRGEGIVDLGPNNKVINNLIYDVGQGISGWKPAINGEYYGNIIWNNGWYAPDRFHGHGIYSQNDNGTKTYENNVVLNNFSFGLHIYAETGLLRNFYLYKNVLYNGLQVMGGYTPLENITLEENYFNSFLQLGYNANSVPNNNLILKNNILPASMSIRWFTNVTATGNTIHNENKYAWAFGLIFSATPDLSTYHFDNNKYYWSYNPGPGYPSDWGVGYKYSGGENNWYLPAWKANGQDVNATVTNVPMKNSLELTLSGKKIFVTKNKYDSRKSTVTIYNYDESPTVTLDIDSVLNIGDTYEIHNTQDYFGDVIYGTYNGSIVYPMTNHTVAKPLGFASEINPNSFPKFGNLAIIKNSGNVAPPNQPCDTVYVDRPVHDTIIKTIHDTVRITTVVHDTIRINTGGIDTTGMICNYAPVANAGNDTTQIAQAHTLKGIGTDRDGTITKYVWVQISGPTAYMPSPNQQNTNITLWVAGTYVFELTVTDDKNATGKDRKTVIRN